jgi:probable F420-dependent oxidoreductase
MRFDAAIPSGAIKHFDDWVGDGDIADFAMAAEAAGFGSVHVTDHPFPDDEWLAYGGHQAFDPFVALSWMAARTDTILLRTNLLVAAYRNPYLTASSVASLDRLSGGRTIVGMGAGYLESEFAVLGADFGARGKYFDEAIEAMTAAWTGESTRRTGMFPADGHTMRPAPVQRPRPPIWIGGNSAVAKRRAAELGDGWIPMPANPTVAKITGTAELTTFEQLAREIDDVARRRQRAGRHGGFDVAAAAFGLPDPADDPDGELARQVVGDHLDIGVTWVSLPCRGRTLDACKAELAWWGDHVVSHFAARGGAPARERTEQGAT